MKRYKLLVTVIIFDLMIVGLHLLFGHLHYFFNLDLEQNLPAIYQGGKLIFISTLIFTHIYLSIQNKDKQIVKSSLIWIPFFMILFFLGIDELSRLHESFTDHLVLSDSEFIRNYLSIFEGFDSSSAVWLLIYIPLFVLFILFISIFLKFLLKNYRKEMIFLVIGVLLFLCVLALEYTNTSSAFWETKAYEDLMILEETAEMIGATFILYFTWIVLKKTSKSINSI
jgi:hypothetical protein